MKEEYFSLFKKELTVLMALKHPQIIQYFGTFSDREHYIVMEYMEAGDLQKVLQKRSFSEQELLKLYVNCSLPIKIFLEPCNALAA